MKAYDRIAIFLNGLSIDYSHKEIKDAILKIAIEIAKTEKEKRRD